MKNIKVINCKINDEDLCGFCEELHFASSHMGISINLNTIEFSYNCLPFSCIDTILALLKCYIIQKLTLSYNSISNTALSDAIIQQACYEKKIHNYNLGIPLVIINTDILQNDNLLGNMEEVTYTFIMNCEIEKKLKDLLENSSQVLMRIHLVNNAMANNELKVNLLPQGAKFFIYECDLKDEVAKELTTCLTKETKLDISYTVASTTTLFAKYSNSNLIISLLDDNLLINTLYLMNVEMQLSCNSQFGKALRNIKRHWEIIDLSYCNITDDGMLELQKCFMSSRSTITCVNFMNNNLTSSAIANLILKCGIKKLDISCNKLQDSEIYNALCCSKRNSKVAVSVEIFTSDHAIVMISNTNSKQIDHSYETCLTSLKINVQVSIMQCLEFEWIEGTLSSFSKLKILQVTLQNNGLTIQQIKRSPNCYLP